MSCESNVAASHWLPSPRGRGARREGQTLGEVVTCHYDMVQKQGVFGKQLLPDARCHPPPPPKGGLPDARIVSPYFEPRRHYLLPITYYLLRHGSKTLSFWAKPCPKPSGINGPYGNTRTQVKL